jgi:hypothetical protein
MVQRDHFQHQLAAASGFAETDRGLFSGWRRHTRNLSLGVRNHQLIRVDQVLRTHSHHRHYVTVEF